MAQAGLNNPYRNSGGQPGQAGLGYQTMGDRFMSVSSLRNRGASDEEIEMFLNAPLPVQPAEAAPTAAPGDDYGFLDKVGYAARQAAALPLEGVGKRTGVDFLSDLGSALGPTDEMEEARSEVRQQRADAVAAGEMSRAGQMARDVGDSVVESSGSLAGSMASGVAGGAALGAVFGPVGVGAGALLGAAAYGIASAYGEAYDQAEQNGLDTEDPNVQRHIDAAALSTGSLDALPSVRILRLFRPAAAEVIQRKVGSEIMQRSLGRRALKEAGTDAFFEGATEASQEALQSILLDPDVVDAMTIQQKLELAPEILRQNGPQYLEAFLAGGILGGAAGGVGAVKQGRDEARAASAKAAYDKAQDDRRSITAGQVASELGVPEDRLRIADDGTEESVAARDDLRADIDAIDRARIAVDDARDLLAAAERTGKPEIVADAQRRVGMAEKEFTAAQDSFSTKRGGRTVADTVAQREEAKAVTLNDEIDRLRQMGMEVDRGAAEQMAPDELTALRDELSEAVEKTGRAEDRAIVRGTKKDMDKLSEAVDREADVRDRIAQRLQGRKEGEGRSEFITYRQNAKKAAAQQSVEQKFVDQDWADLDTLSPEERISRAKKIIGKRKPGSQTQAEIGREIRALEARRNRSRSPEEYDSLSRQIEAKRAERDADTPRVAVARKVSEDARRELQATQEETVQGQSTTPAEATPEPAASEAPGSVSGGAPETVAPPLNIGGISEDTATAVREARKMSRSPEADSHAGDAGRRALVEAGIAEPTDAQIEEAVRGHGSLAQRVRRAAKMQPEPVEPVEPEQAPAQPVTEKSKPSSAPAKTEVQLAREEGRAPDMDAPTYDALEDLTDLTDRLSKMEDQGTGEAMQVTDAIADLILGETGRELTKPQIREAVKTKAGRDDLKRGLADRKKRAQPAAAPAADVKVLSDELMSLRFNERERRDELTGKIAEILSKEAGRKVAPGDVFVALSTHGDLSRLTAPRKERAAPVQKGIPASDPRHRGAAADRNHPWVSLVNDVDLDAGMEAHEDFLRQQMKETGFEYAATYDLDGALRGIGTNRDRNRVASPENKRSEPGIFTHTHPERAPFSPSDVGVMGSENFQRVRAVLEDQTIEMRPGEKMGDYVVSTYADAVYRIASEIVPPRTPVIAGARITQEAMLRAMDVDGLIEYVTPMTGISAEEESLINEIVAQILETDNRLRAWGDVGNGAAQDVEGGGSGRQAGSGLPSPDARPVEGGATAAGLKRLFTADEPMTRERRVANEERVAEIADDITSRAVNNAARRKPVFQAMVAKGEISQERLADGIQAALSTDGMRHTDAILSVLKALFPGQAPLKSDLKKVTEKGRPARWVFDQKWSDRMNVALYLMNDIGEAGHGRIKFLTEELVRDNGKETFLVKNVVIDEELLKFAKFSDPGAVTFTLPMSDPDDVSAIIRRERTNLLPEGSAALERAKATARVLQRNVYRLDQDYIAALEPDDMISSKALAAKLMKRQDDGSVINTDPDSGGVLTPRQEATLRSMRFRAQTKLSRFKRIAKRHGDNPVGFRYRIDDKGRIQADGEFTPQTGDAVKGAFIVQKDGGEFSLKGAPSVDHSASGWQVTALIARDEVAADNVNLGPGSAGDAAVAKRDLYTGTMERTIAQIEKDAAAGDPQAREIKEKLLDRGVVVDRNSIKPSVIAVNYGADGSKFVQSMRELYQEKMGGAGGQLPGTWGYFGGTVYEKLREAAPHSLAFQDWALDSLKRLVTAVEKAGKSKPKLAFTIGIDGKFAAKRFKLQSVDALSSAPNGYNPETGETVPVKYRQTIDVMLNDVDPMGTARTIYSQMVQAFDAAIMHRAVELFRGANPGAFVTTNHDSYTVEPGMEGQMAAAARQAMAEVMSGVGDVPARLHEEIVEQAKAFGVDETFPPPPAEAYGNYDVATGPLTSVPVWGENEEGDYAPSFETLAKSPSEEYTGASIALGRETYPTGWLAKSGVKEISMGQARRLIYGAASLSGARIGDVREAAGGWSDPAQPGGVATEPSTVIDLLSHDPAEVRKFAAVLGHMAGQHSVMTVETAAKEPNSQLVVIRTSAPASEVFKAVSAVDPEKFGGFSAVEGGLSLVVPGEYDEALMGRMMEELEKYDAEVEIEGAGWAFVGAEVDETSEGGQGYATSLRNVGLGETAAEEILRGARRFSEGVFQLGEQDPAIAENLRVVVSAPEGMEILDEGKTVMDSVAEVANDPLGHARTWMEKLEDNFFNQFAPLRRLEVGLKGELGIGMDSAFKAVETAINDSGRNEALMTRGAARLGEHGDFDIAPGTVGLRTIFDSVVAGKDGKDAGQAMSDWMGWMIAKRIKELHSVDPSLAFPMKDVDAALAKEQPSFAPAAEMWRAHNNANIDFLVATGRISKAQATAMKSTQHYVPFYRSESNADGSAPELVFPDGFERKYGGGGAGGVLSRDPGIKKLVGGDRKAINNVLKNMIRNSQAMAAAGMRNSAANKSLALMNEAGLVEVSDAKVSTPDGTVAVAKPHKNAVRMWVGGKEYWVRPKPGSEPYVVALAGLQPRQRNAIEQGMAAVGALFRQGITLSPAFMFRNAIRGMVANGLLTSGANLTLTNNTFTGFYDALRGGPATQAFKAKSGMGDFRFGNPDAGFGKNDILMDYGMVGKSFAYRIRKAIDRAEHVGSATELADRVAAYNTMIENGYRPDEAAYQARAVIDYARRGASPTLRVMLPLVPFLNARLQGLSRLTEGALGKRGPLGRKQAAMQLAMNGMIMSMISAGIWWLNGLDEENEARYTAEPLYRRLNYHILYDGETAIYIPKAFELGYLFSSLPELLLDKTFRGVDEVDQGVRKMLADTVMFNAIPAALLPVIEAQANYSYFRDGPIEGMREQSLRARDRVTGAGSLARFVGQQMGVSNATKVSPVMIQHWLDGYGGAYMQFLGAMTDFAAAEMGLGSAPVGGAYGDVPVVSQSMNKLLGGTLRRADQAQSKYVEEFYRNKDHVTQIYRSAKAAVDDGQIEYARRLLERASGTPAAYRLVNRAGSVLSDLNAQIRAIRSSTAMNPAQKRKAIEPLIVQRNNLVFRVSQVIDKIEEEQGVTFEAAS